METTELAEHEIIRDILKGDRNKYALLMQKYNQRLYRICKAYLKDENEIEDVMQDSYIKAYEHLKTFEGKSSFSTWLTRILINECLQRLRQKKKYVTVSHSNDNTNTMNLSDH